MNETFKNVVFSKEYEENGIDFRTVITMPVKFKHCHGDTENIKKANKLQNFLKEHFVSLLNKPRKVSKLQALATKFKSIFNKNRSK
jgi:hypothetical protein